MRADNTDRLRRASRQRAEQTRARALAALETMGSAPITVARLAAAAGVSRSWIYTQPELLERTSVGATERPPRHDVEIPETQRASTTSLQRRLEIAHHRVRQLTHENSQLRDELSLAYGRLRAERHD
jgi:Family of unknown function (DUF6262)